MEYKDSLPYSQAPATRCYPEPQVSVHVQGHAK